MRKMAKLNGRSGRGQALIEFALTIPLLFLLILNLVNFAGLLYAWVTVSNAARSGAQFLMMGGATLFGPAPPTDADITAVVTADLYSLPNKSSAVITVCRNVDGTITPSGCAIPVDPELTGGAHLYVSGMVDVSYTYQPFFSFWNFSKLGIHLTVPTTTVHRKVVMRLAGGG
jgi:hypothetical protein